MAIRSLTKVILLCSLFIQLIISPTQTRAQSKAILSPEEEAYFLEVINYYILYNPDGLENLKNVAPDLYSTLKNKPVDARKDTNFFYNRIPGPNKDWLLLMLSEEEKVGEDIYVLDYLSDRQIESLKEIFAFNQSSNRLKIRAELNWHSGLSATVDVTIPPLEYIHELEDTLAFLDSYILPGIQFPEGTNLNLVLGNKIEHSLEIKNPGFQITLASVFPDTIIVDMTYVKASSLFGGLIHEATHFLEHYMTDEQRVEFRAKLRLTMLGPWLVSNNQLIRAPENEAQITIEWNEMRNTFLTHLDNQILSVEEISLEEFKQHYYDPVGGLLYPLHTPNEFASTLFEAAFGGGVDYIFNKLGPGLNQKISIIQPLLDPSLADPNLFHLNDQFEQQFLNGFLQALDQGTDSASRYCVEQMILVVINAFGITDPDIINTILYGNGMRI